MEDANTALIQKMYAAFGNGDVQTLLANVAPNAEWVDYGPPSVPYFGDFTGRVEDFFRAIGGSTHGGNVAIEQYIAAGDTVVARGRYTATVNTTGTKIDSPILHLFTIRDGKVTSWKGYGDTAAVVA